MRPAATCLCRSAVAALWLLTGCTPHPAVLGAAPAGEESPVAQATALPLGSVVAVSGRLVEKCPVAGCWFTLQDDTGVVRVDTKGAGFTILEVPLGRRVKVAGRLASFGTDRQLLASGLSY